MRANLTHEWPFYLESYLRGGAGLNGSNGLEVYVGLIEKRILMVTLGRVAGKRLIADR